MPLFAQFLLVFGDVVVTQFVLFSERGNPVDELVTENIESARSCDKIKPDKSKIAYSDHQKLIAQSESRAEIHRHDKCDGNDNCDNIADNQLFRFFGK